MDEIPQSAIQHVTRFMASLLRRQLSAAAPNLTPTVTLLPPGSNALTSPGVNLYLYQVAESPSTKNQDWRGNRTTPPIRRPILGLQLSYLVTATAPENDDNAHLYLGVAMSTFHNYPILNDVHLPEDVREDGTIVPAVDADTLPSFILDSYEQIKVNLLPTTVDQVSRIWATLNQPYRLSVAYEVSLVELIPESPTPRRGDIVLETNIDVATLGPPVVNEIAPAAGALLTNQNNTLQPTKLTIDGSRLVFQIKKNDVPIPGHAPQLPVVRVGGRIVQIEESPRPSDQSLVIAMPLDLDAGPQIDLRVTLRGQSSTPTIFLVTPWLSRSMPLRSAFETEAVELTLEGFGFDPVGKVLVIDPARNVVVKSYDIDPGGTEKKATATIPAELPNGLFDVRVQKSDGSVSNRRTLEVLPRVTGVVADEIGPEEKKVHILTISGDRLIATDTDAAKSRSQIVIDGVPFGVPHKDPPEHPVVVKLKRKLVEGSHSLIFSIDGHVSPPFLFEVTSQ